MSSLKDKRLNHLAKWDNAPQTARPAKPVEIDMVSLAQTTKRGGVKRPRPSSGSTAPAKSVPLAKVMKLIIEYLKDINGQKLTLEDLIDKAVTLRKENPDEKFDSDDEAAQANLDETRNAIHADEKIREQLFKKLKENLKIEFSVDPDTQQKSFAYKSTYQLRDTGDIIRLLENQYPEGVDQNELKESYKGIDQDMEKLKVEERVYYLKNKEQKADMLFYKDPTLVLEVDGRLKGLWKTTKQKLPDQQHIGEFNELMKVAGLTPVETIEWVFESAEQKKIEALEEENRSKKKTKRTRRIKKLTNEHIDLGTQ
ncbi:general transcription factor IIE subunit 2 [Acrasis kona]|uniref:General transcription factor IIE subunit 2 n=1 Tax=Acrasis kona TaxID=1008807 RepID=A0AAW2ZEH8_9EUKA